MNHPMEIQIELEHDDHRCILIGKTDQSVSECLASQGLPLNIRCGQRGLCRGCEVELQKGQLTVGEHVVSAPTTVQACRARFSGPATIHVPLRSRIEHKPQVSETFDISVPYAHDPPFPCTPGERDTAFAVDIGTTTVVVLLVDLITGEALSRASDFNAQIRFGDNVLTRIEAGGKPANLKAMQQAILDDTIQPLLLRACERAGRSLERLAGGTIAGNTAMLHLLTGTDPTPLGMAPFTPPFISGRETHAGELGLHRNGIAANTPIHLLPGIAAYIGADITAGVFASGMVYDASPSLLIDIGTNGEMVLQSAGKLTACSCPAGPAFEGSGLNCGTRAREGAISDLNIQLSPFQVGEKTIGEVPLSKATGICGSAYLDFLSTARKCGLLNHVGRFDRAVWDQLPDQNKLTADDERALLLSKANLRISEVDVALLLQAKAAIGAGIELLLQSADIRADEIGTVYLAGGFGMHLNISHAINIGLLPGFREEQIQVVGNTALGGTLLAALDRSIMPEMEMLRSKIEIIELNLVEGFEDCYIDHLMLP